MQTYAVATLHTASIKLQGHRLVMLIQGQPILHKYVNKWRLFEGFTLINILLEFPLLLYIVLSMEEHIRNNWQAWDI